MSAPSSMFDNSMRGHAGLFFTLLLSDGVGVDVDEDVDAGGSSARDLSTFWKKLKRVFCTAFFVVFSKHCFVATENIFQFSLELAVHLARCFIHSNPPVMLIVLLI